MTSNPKYEFHFRAVTHIDSHVPDWDRAIDSTIRADSFSEAKGKFLEAYGQLRVPYTISTKIISISEIRYPVALKELKEEVTLLKESMTSMLESIEMELNTHSPILNHYPQVNDSGDIEDVAIDECVACGVAWPCFDHIFLSGLRGVISTEGNIQ